MSTHVCKIAKAAGIEWGAASEVAGPYFLCEDFIHITTTFGARHLGVSRPGTVTQREAFLTSRAAFFAIRDEFDGETLSSGERRDAIKVATKVARAEWKSWQDTLHRFAGRHEQGFNAAVSSRFSREWAARAAVAVDDGR